MRPGPGPGFGAVIPLPARTRCTANPQPTLTRLPGGVATLVPERRARPRSGIEALAAGRSGHGRAGCWRDPHPGECPPRAPSRRYCFSTPRQGAASRRGKEGLGYLRLRGRAELGGGSGRTRCSTTEWRCCMIPTALNLPYRPAKPRQRGLTMVIDNGLPTRLFTDAVESAGDLIDFIKFGWGTAVVSRNIGEKIAVCEANGIGYFFGGTLFEKHLLQGRFDDFRRYCADHRCRYVEVSNGTVSLTNDEKARYVEKLAAEFIVFSEVGVKDAARSEQLKA